jgi:predicted dehydrogenase
MVKRPLKIAICGFGRFAERRIIPALEKTSKIELVAVIDRGSRASKLPKNILRFKSFDEMLKSTLIDCVYIATTNYLHAPQAIECLKNGLHVLCEKPMAINKSDCSQMIDAAIKFNVQLSIGHMLRFSPAIIKVRDLMNIGTLGKINSLELFFNYDIKFTERSWAKSKNNSGGGALMDAGVHCIDTIQFLLDSDIKLKNVKMFNIDNNKIEQGIKSTFDAGDTHCLIEVHSNKEYFSCLVINSENGKLKLENFASTDSKVLINFTSIRENVKNQSFTIDVANTYLNQIENFVNTITSGKTDLKSAEQAEKAIELIETIYAKQNLSST